MAILQYLKLLLFIKKLILSISKMALVLGLITIIGVKLWQLMVAGITAMSIILSGYEKNYNPEFLRQKYYPKLNADEISFELANSFGIKNSDFYYDDLHLSKDYLQNHLNSNKPVLICVWNKPNVNRWTTASHYMVLLATDGNDLVYVSNPNGLDNSSKSSGWYSFNEIVPYLAKALYVEED